DFKVQVVVDHHLESLARQTFSLVLADRLSVYAACRTVSVGVYPSSGGELFQKFRSEFFVELLRHITKSIFERDPGLRLCQAEASVRSAADSRLKLRIFWVFVIELYCHCSVYG